MRVGNHVIMVSHANFFSSSVFRKCPLEMSRLTIRECQLSSLHDPALSWK